MRKSIDNCLKGNAQVSIGKQNPLKQENIVAVVVNIWQALGFHSSARSSAIWDEERRVCAWSMPDGAAVG